jgi:hypothetical protein
MEDKGCTAFIIELYSAFLSVLLARPLSAVMPKADANDYARADER